MTRAPGDTSSTSEFAKLGAGVTATRIAPNQRSGQADDPCPPPDRSTDRATGALAIERRPR
jgi:hypothetical protein